MKCARSAVLLLLLSVPVFSSAAQRPIGPVSLCVSAGLSTPQGDTQGFFDRGAQFGALADVRTALPWLLVRVDGSWQSLGRGQQQIISVDDGEVAQADYHRVRRDPTCATLPGDSAQLHSGDDIGRAMDLWLRNRTSLGQRRR